MIPSIRSLLMLTTLLASLAHFPGVDASPLPMPVLVPAGSSPATSHATTGYNTATTAAANGKRKMTKTPVKVRQTTGWWQRWWQ